MLSWSQVSELKRNNFTVGSHLCLHKDLSRVERADGMAELSESKAAIEDRLSEECRHFAYPWGRFTSKSVEWVGAAGYSYTATIEPRALPRTFNPLKIPRYDIKREYT